MAAILILTGILVILGCAAYILQRCFRATASGLGRSADAAESGGAGSSTDAGPSVSSEASNDTTPTKRAESSECCGMHAVCEKLADLGDDIEYFDDEELDTMAGIDASAYTPEQVEQFREVLTTLADGEAPDWLGSLRRRNIALPEALRDEVMMLVEDAALNNAKTQSRNKMI